MQKKYTLVFFILFFLILDHAYAKMKPQAAPIYSETTTTKQVFKKKFKLFRGLKKRIQHRQPQPPNDDLWVLQLIFLVAFLGIVTFAASAIMLAIYGLSTIWLTLFIIGGVIGVLPMLIIGAALLFRF